MDFGLLCQGGDPQGLLATAHSVIFKTKQPHPHHLRGQKVSFFSPPISALPGSVPHTELRKETDQNCHPKLKHQVFKHPWILTTFPAPLLRLISRAHNAKRASWYNTEMSVNKPALKMEIKLQTTSKTAINRTKKKGNKR